MSEPQHPLGADTNAGGPAPGNGNGPSPVQPGLDTMTTAGARLAQLRQAKGWSIEDVSARLKVAGQKLRALEAGDLGPFSDTTFALGVVRSYAKVLGADPEPFVQALRRERGVPQPDLSMPASAGSDLPRGRVSLSLGSGAGSQRRRSWLWGLAAVIVAVIAISMWRTNSGESSAWFTRLVSMAGGSPAQPGAASASVTEGVAAAPEGASAGQAQAPADASAADLASGTETNAPSDTAPPATAAAGTAQQGAATAAPATTAPATVATASAAAAPNATNAASAPAAATAASGAATFAIHTTADTWVSVRQKDGKEVYSGLIHGNDAREITGIAPLKVTVGNKAGVASMTIDGQPVDASKYASARGNVARFVLP